MLKRIILLLTTFTLLFAFVTYQPKKVDAYAGVAAKVEAQQAIKAVTKTAVDSTVQRMLVKELLEEVTESYAKKQGYKLIESGGQRMYMKATYNETEKVLLKKQIDKVIDKEVYGNTPKFIKFLDWFVGVGAVIAVGQVLYATLTGEFQSYMGDIITQAMVDLGWLTPAQPKTANPTNPVGTSAFTNSPEYDYTSTRPTLSNINISHTQIYNVNANFSGDVDFYLKLPQPQFKDGSVFFMEFMPSSSQGMDIIPRLNSLYAGSSSFMGANSIYFDGNTFNTNGGSPIDVYVGGKYLKSYGSTQATLLQLTDQSLSRTMYNRHIIQHKTYDPIAKRYVSRWIMQDTYLKIKPDIYLQYVHPVGTSFSNEFSDSYRFANYVWDNPMAFPFKLKLGYFRDVDLALSEDMLPRPKLNTNDVIVPVVTKENRVPIPNITVLPGGHTYDPVEQVIKDPSGQVITNPESLPLPTPDPVISESPEGEVEIDDTPTGVPVPPGGITPPIDGGGTGDGMTTGDPTNIEWDKLKAIPNIFTKKFPFSLPWDAKRFIDSVLGDIPQAKDIVVNLEEIGGVHIGMNITLPDFFDQFFDFTRVITLVMFDIGLIYGLYRLLGGAS